MVFSISLFKGGFLQCLGKEEILQKFRKTLFINRSIKLRSNVAIKYLRWY